VLFEDHKDIVLEKRLATRNDGEIDPHFLHLDQDGIDFFAGKLQGLVVVAGITAIAGKVAAHGGTDNHGGGRIVPLPVSPGLSLIGSGEKMVYQQIGNPLVTLVRM
jgi:hypothetical protein